jgi:hypothetical protein
VTLLILLWEKLVFITSASKTGTHKFCVLSTGYALGANCLQQSTFSEADSLISWSTNSLLFMEPTSVARRQ